MRGRPSTYSQAIADEICQRLSCGETLTKILKEKNIAQSVVWCWRKEHPDFQKAYAQARVEQQECWADEIMEISDDATNDTIKTEDGRERCDNEWVQRSRLRVDTRKWLMARIFASQYGDKTQTEISGKDGGPVVISWGEPPAGASGSGGSSK